MHAGRVRCRRIVFGNTLGWVFLLAWVVWNFWWFAHQSLAPSLLLYLFDLPAPTTGLTRSLIAVFQGDWGAAFHWHPLSIPLILLFFASFFVWLRRMAGDASAVIPRWMVIAWILLLGSSWVVKCWQGPAAW